ncbi:cbb3-type cytochrome oxidase assembly protein CcoS [Psychrobacter sp. APC 3279]|uniref:cbb3-type cytochrome oxidase assembly protein CcoS n=1 Tax=Psychrobacter sp. APC 3279 TaxID=3035189 RepID=UPI0025B56422|nr:cbb3-type cytochrome oxidase assembly protein CcoS [Psychrobacter sp. APC 3279]MDN3442175.1 cbb3-type cytochrome oxidase assembly protein CcoS [Psychrobacter sp. APC 3279]
MLSIFLLIPLSLMLFVVAIWAVRYAVKSNQFEDLDNASQRIILDDRQERRQTMQAHERSAPTQQQDKTAATDENNDNSEMDKNSEI